jgi:murein DD-endopeptidase MepM/ murein hydrolase activator NlpD
MKSLLCIVLALLACTAPALAAPQGLQLRFCPSAQVRTYPLESRSGIEGLLLQNVAVINRGAAAVNVNSISIELLRAGETLDARKLDAADVAHVADRSAKYQAAGLIAGVPFQFCGTDMIGAGVTLVGPALATNQAMLVMQQTFAFHGARDTLRVRVDGDSDGRPVEVVASIPIVTGFSKNVYRFPLRGVWYAGVGPTFHTGHRWALPEEFAFDIAKLDTGGRTYRGDGAKFSDYYAYGADVRAAADGRVIAVETAQPENPDMMRKPTESQDAYAARVQQNQAALLAKGTSGLAGNYVMIDHGGGEYSLYAHMRPGSVRVHVGDQVRGGDVIGALGSSGNSTEPHLHFQLCDKPDPLMCAGIPINFTGIEIPWADYPRPLQSGDVVIAQ